MPSDAPAVKHNRPDINLVAALALYSARRDKALGLDWHSRQSRGLVWYYNQLVRTEISRYASATFLRQLAEENARRKDAIMERAPGVTDQAERNRILVKLKKLRKEQRKIAEKLEELAGG